MVRKQHRSDVAAAEQTEANALAKRFERRVRLSRFALLGERIWEALLWPFIVVCAFLVLTLLDGWTLLPPLAHRVLLGAFGLALLVSFLPLLRLPLPTREEALRRLERTAKIKHRPASSYEDTLGSTPPRETAFLWSAHRERLARIVARLKPSWPAPRTDRKDPYAIRAALLLGVVAALLAAGGDVWTKMLTAFSPTAGGPPALIRLDAWVTPPVYTGIAPIVLADGSETVGTGAETFRALSVPERSQLIVRAHAPDGQTVSLATKKDDGSEPKAVEPRTDGSQGLVEFNVGLKSPISAGVMIGGETVAQWQFSLTKDEPPAISLMGDPTTTPRGGLRLVYSATDDHGVAGAQAKFALADDASLKAPAAEAEEEGEQVENDPLLKPPAMPLQLPRTNAKKVEGRATQDLTSHPWAGFRVRMTLVARDQAEQTGESRPYEFVLPERTFTKPLAKALVEQRKKLVREPGSEPVVARALDALTLGGEKVIDDSVVYLSIRNVYWRLQNEPSRESVASVVDQLWSTALRIEEGDLPDAERELKSAQEALRKALQDNAPSGEIKRLVEELRAALGRYLQALASQAQDKGNMPTQQSRDGDQLVSQQDLDKMLKSIQDLAEAGSKDMAERMLSELNDILDRMQMGNFAENAQQRRAGRMMKDLNDMVSDQQKLLDDTFAEKRRQQGEQGGSDQFQVSPPGQPMDFGQSMMSPFFDMPQPGNTQGGAKAQGQTGQQGQPRGEGQMQLGQQQRGQSPGQLGQLGKRQEELRDKLQGLIDRLRMEGGDASSEFKGAKDAMNEAKDAIGEPNLDRATQNQSLALDRLRKGTQSMAQQMMENGEMQAGQGPGSNGRDPLGRPDRSNRPDLGLSVKVPDQIDIQRAREVLDEVRRRLGDPARPTFELDYLERLIRSF